MQEINNTQNSHIIKLRQWYLHKDEEAFRQLIKRADHSLTDGFLPEHYTDNCEYGWLMGMANSLLYGDEFHYAIEVNGTVVGCVNISRCGGVYCHTGVLRLILLPEMCNQGIATQVVQQIAHQALHYDSNNKYMHTEGFERLCAMVIEGNKAAERVLEKNGFVFEGILRNSISKNGKIYNQRVYGLTLTNADTPMQSVIQDNKFYPQNTELSNNITLKPWCMDDAKAYIDMLSKVDFTNEEEECYTDYSDAEYKLYKLIKDEDVNENIYRGIWIDGKLVGKVQMVRLRNCDGHVGCLVTKEASGHGVGTEAVRKMIELTFDTTNIERLTAIVFSPNKASKRMVEKLGFAPEAIMRRDVYKNECYYDSLVYGLLRKDTGIPTPSPCRELNDEDVTPGELVDLGLSVKWAACNVGATQPHEYGDYFAWGETSAKNCYDKTNSKTYGKSMDDISGNASYDAARANWGGSWRVPTKSEMEELVKKCYWKRIVLSGINGYKVIGPNGNSIFLPFTGHYEGMSLKDVGTHGCYWSSTPHESRNGVDYNFMSELCKLVDSPYEFINEPAYNLNISRGYQSVNWCGCDEGRAVRPVAD